MPSETPGAPPPGGLPSPAGSTGSHHPGADGLSGSLNSNSASRRTLGSDILQVLALPGSSPIALGASPPGIPANIDDAPTVITQNRPPFSPPLPLIASNEPQSIQNRRLGHFELIEAIGAGGMAAVIKARDLELGRIVALKILPPETARDPEGVTRFKQEARAAAMLDHENVARVYYCGEDQGLHFIAFEFVEGENLRILIDRRGQLPSAECVRYMIQVAAGLNHAAERGVVHRDIKPSNIIITPDGRAKIVDMGLARHLSSLAVNGGVTQSGVTLGTFDYISPEQALDPRRADVRSDIYSLGCAFYHALTGRPPVPEGTAAKKLYAHQHIDPIDPRILNPAIPDGLAVVLSGMMAKDPDQRYQSPTELIAHLKGLLDASKSGLDRVTNDSVVQAVPAAQALPPAAPRLRLSWLAAVCAVMAAVAAFAITTGGSDSPSPPPPWAADAAGAGNDPGTPTAAGATVPSLGERVATVENAAQLVELLKDPALKGEHQRIQLGSGTYDLASQNLREPLAVERRDLEIIGAPAGGTEIVLPPHGGIIVRAAALTVSRIRFEMRPSPDETDEDRSIHGRGLEFQAILSPTDSSSRVARLQLEDCFFSGVYRPQDDVIAIAASAAPSSVKLNVNPDLVALDVARCGFAIPGVAIQLPARSNVDIRDCGFRARTALRVPGAPDDPVDSNCKIKLDRSSFMVDPGDAVVDLGGPGKVTAGNCVFAALGQAQPAWGTVLKVGAGVSYYGFEGDGQKNAYYQVKALAITGKEPGILSFEECKSGNYLQVLDRNAVVLSQRPWASPDPASLFADGNPWVGFGLRIATEPALFVDSSLVVIGAQFFDGLSRRRAYPSVPLWPPAKPVKAVESVQKVWYPDARDEDLVPGTSNDLPALLRNAKPDDVILIRHNGFLHMPDTVELRSRAGAEFRVTFKPYPDCRPVLTSRDNPNLDQPLFQLKSGEAAFEGLQFLLKPSLPQNPLKVAAVRIAGGKGCTFTDCVFTLAHEEEQTAAVVWVADPGKIMAMAEGFNRPTPEITFRQCVIRGKGRGIWLDDSRVAKIELNQTLTALDGPLLLADPGGKSVAGAHSQLKLSRVTAFVGGPLVVMRGSKSAEMRVPGLAPLEVHADECLFAAVPGAGQPLVELDGIDPAEVKSKSILDWQIKTANRYANFDPEAVVAVVRPPADASMQKEWDWNDWLAFAREPVVRPIGRVTFALAPRELKELAGVKPDDVQVKEIKFQDMPDAKPDDAGITSRLPAPWMDEAKPE